MRKFLLTSTIVLVFGLYVWRVSASPQPDAASALIAPDKRSLAIPQGTADRAAAPDAARAVADATTPVAPAPAPAPTPSPAPATKPAPAPAPKPSPAPAPKPAPKPAPVPQGKFRNGTYQGDPADAYYGNVQVSAVVSGGRLSQVEILDYPSDRGHSIMINNYALPTLVSEAVRAQSASVQIVSGATDTSMAFRESLGSALAQALN